MNNIDIKIQYFSCTYFQVFHPNNKMKIMKIIYKLKPETRKMKRIIFTERTVYFLFII